MRQRGDADLGTLSRRIAVARQSIGVLKPLRRRALQARSCRSTLWVGVPLPPEVGGQRLAQPDARPPARRSQVVGRRPVAPSGGVQRGSPAPRGSPLTKDRRSRPPRSFCGDARRKRRSRRATAPASERRLVGLRTRPGWTKNATLLGCTHTGTHGIRRRAHGLARPRVLPADGAGAAREPEARLAYAPPPRGGACARWGSARKS